MLYSRADYACNRSAEIGTPALRLLRSHPINRSEPAFVSEDTQRMAPEMFMAIRTAHIACAFASGSLFAVRGAASLRGAAWPQATLAKRGSMLIDSLLLALGVVLMIATHQYPFAVSWLSAKLLLIVVYIVLGIFALKRGRTPAVRLACFALAVMTFLMILAVAVTHNPAGVFAGFLG